MNFCSIAVAVGCLALALAAKEEFLALEALEFMNKLYATANQRKCYSEVLLKIQSKLLLNLVIST